ncbi:MAG: 2-phosphosulfolactate phosphatase [Bacteroidales bacterium]|nr:2-phosphosulfolactate phosphatase [Bacteroidales bacterium]
MRIEVSLSPALYPFRTITDNHVTVAIDVLRATTAVCAAMQAGCSEVVPLDSLDALDLYRGKGYKIAAERGGKKLPGSDYGNSPTEYLKHDLHGVRLAYSTTNGTVSILRAADADITLVGSFANISALVERLIKEQKDVVILCSGWRNDFCIEDTLVAGAIIEKLTTITTDMTIAGDAAQMALTLWQVAGNDPFGYCQRASHVHRLYSFGAEEDVRFAFKQDTCPLVPMLKNGLLTL